MNTTSQTIESNAVALHVDFDERAGASAPVLMFSNSLGTRLRMWDAQAEAFGERFRLLRYDTRGHGRSALGSGPPSFEQFGRDVLGVLDALGLDKVAFCGLSMGGLTGQWLGLNAPERLSCLALCNTAAQIGTPATWDARIRTVRTEGMPALTEGVLERWFTAAFRDEHPEAVKPVRDDLLATPPEGYARACEALRDADFRGALSRISLPTLIIAGSHDPSTPPADGVYLASQIAGSRYAELNSAHLSNIEQTQGFNRALGAFLEEHAHG